MAQTAEGQTKPKKKSKPIMIVLMGYLDDGIKIWSKKLMSQRIVDLTKRTQ
jgi:hypothetical protein